MRVALAVNQITEGIERNKKKVLEMICLSVDNRTELILFPEAAVTGLINNDDPVHDLRLGLPIPGKFTDSLCQLADRFNIHIGIGLLERESGKLFDTAVLIVPEKGIILKYRRITKGWHGKKADPEVYGHGDEIRVVKTRLGSFSFLICGDLFCDDLVQDVRRLGPDYLLFPFARSFEDGVIDQARWNREEKFVYAKRVESVGVATVMVNSFGIDGSFGGAMVVAPSGEIRFELDIGKDGILFADLTW